MVGFLAATPEEYAQILAHIFSKDSSFDTQAEKDMREHARSSVKRFSDQAFQDHFSSLWMAAFPM